MSLTPTVSLRIRGFSVPKSLLSSLSSVPQLQRSQARTFSTTLQRDATWGFIGLGQMGYLMAKNLRAKIPATDTLLVRDVNENATTRFVEETKEAAKSSGAADGTMKVEVAQSAREVAEQSTVIITSLPEPEHVKDVFHSILKHGDLPALEEERLFIDTSTIDPASSKEIANAIHSTRTGHFVDAPMSGGVVGARAGTLSFMFGASSQSGQLIERVRAVLMLMGKKAWHLGPPGAGVSAEAMNLGTRWGLDPKSLADMINTSTGRCWPMEVNNPVPGVVETAPASRGYEGGFGVGLMKKDLRLAITAAKESGTPLALAETAREVYNSVEQEYRGKDFSVVYKWLQDRSEQ
ncbi:hypothetical protein KXX62_003239 [Aspergillus fumigatus]|nr:hypothetical protein KXX62_003239 [Aspergillus fumigatus]